MSDYYTITDLVTPSKFFAMPKELFADKFKEISLDAKLLFTVLLDKVGLSIKNNYADTDGRVYIICKQESITELMGWSRRKTVDLFKELESNMMIERKKRGNNLPDLIYVLKVLTTAVDAVFDNSENSVSDFSMSKPTCKNKTFGYAKKACPGRAKSAQVNNTNINYTKLSDTRSIYQEKSQKDLEVANPDERNVMDRLTAEQYVKSKIDFDVLTSNFQDDDNRFLCNTIVSVMTDIYSQKFGKIKVNGYPISYSSLREKFLTINSLHIEYVLECINKREPDAEPIRNWRTYLTTALYNAESSMSVYYKNLVRFDRYTSSREVSNDQSTAIKYELNYLVV